MFYEFFQNPLAFGIYKHKQIKFLRKAYALQAKNFLLSSKITIEKIVPGQYKQSVGQISILKIQNML